MVNWGPIEICFIVDLGTDMKNWFKIFKKVAMHEVQKFRDDCRGYVKVRAAFVGYRTAVDFQPIVIFDLTSNLMQLESKINSIQTNSPHQCRSMRDAYEFANNLEWVNYAGGTIIHIGDSPPYGVKYHNQTIYDLYPSTNPTGIPIEHIIERLTFKGIHLVIFQMHESMDIVVDIIRKAFHNTKRVHENQITIFNKKFSEQEFENELKAQINKHLFILTNGN